MPVASAFNTSADIIDSQDVPRLHDPGYSYSDFSGDKKLLEAWLKQQGLTDAEIKTRSFMEWSRIKTDFLLVRLMN